MRDLKVVSREKVLGRALGVIMAVSVVGGYFADKANAGEVEEKLYRDAAKVEAEVERETSLIEAQANKQSKKDMAVLKKNVVNLEKTAAEFWIGYEEDKNRNKKGDENKDSFEDDCKKLRSEVKKFKGIIDEDIIAKSIREQGKALGESNEKIDKALESVGLKKVEEKKEEKAAQKQEERPTLFQSFVNAWKSVFNWIMD